MLLLLLFVTIQKGSMPQWLAGWLAGWLAVSTSSGGLISFYLSCILQQPFDRYRATCLLATYYAVLCHPVRGTLSKDLFDLGL